jgi:hypothetical protein
VGVENSRQKKFSELEILVLGDSGISMKTNFKTHPQSWELR